MGRKAFRVQPLDASLGAAERTLITTRLARWRRW
jgi:hypothetical protein